MTHFVDLTAAECEAAMRNISDDAKQYPYDLRQAYEVAQVLRLIAMRSDTSTRSWFGQVARSMERVAEEQHKTREFIRWLFRLFEQIGTMMISEKGNAIALLSEVAYRAEQHARWLKEAYGVDVLKEGGR